MIGAVLGRRTLEGRYCSVPGCIGGAEGAVVMPYTNGPTYLCGRHLALIRTALVIVLRRAEDRLGREVYP